MTASTPAPRPVASTRLRAAAKPAKQDITAIEDDPNCGGTFCGFCWAQREIGPDAGSKAFRWRPGDPVYTSAGAR